MGALAREHKLTNMAVMYQMKFYGKHASKTSYILDLKHDSFIRHFISDHLFIFTKVKPASVDRNLQKPKNLKLTHFNRGRNYFPAKFDAGDFLRLAHYQLSYTTTLTI